MSLPRMIDEAGGTGADTDRRRLGGTYKVISGREALDLRGCWELGKAGAWVAFIVETVGAARLEGTAGAATSFIPTRPVSAKHLKSDEILSHTSFFIFGIRVINQAKFSSLLNRQHGRSIDKVGGEKADESTRNRSCVSSQWNLR